MRCQGGENTSSLISSGPFWRLSRGFLIVTRCQGGKNTSHICVNGCQGVVASAWLLCHRNFIAFPLECQTGRSWPVRELSRRGYSRPEEDTRGMIHVYVSASVERQSIAPQSSCLVIPVCIQRRDANGPLKSESVRVSGQR